MKSPGSCSEPSTGLTPPRRSLGSFVVLSRAPVERCASKKSVSERDGDSSDSSPVPLVLSWRVQLEQRFLETLSAH